MREFHLDGLTILLWCVLVLLPGSLAAEFDSSAAARTAAEQQERTIEQHTRCMHRARERNDDNNAKLTVAFNELHEITVEKMNSLNELRNGFYCDQCGRTKSQIERETKASFQEHLTSVQGQAIPASLEKIEALAAQYDKRIETVRKRVDGYREHYNKLSTEFHGCRNERITAWRQRERAQRWASFLEEKERMEARARELEEIERLKQEALEARRREAEAQAELLRQAQARERDKINAEIARRRKQEEEAYNAIIEEFQRQQLAQMAQKPEPGGVDMPTHARLKSRLQDSRYAHSSSPSYTDHSRQGSLFPNANTGRSWTEIAGQELMRRWNASPFRSRLATRFDNLFQAPDMFANRQTPDDRSPSQRTDEAIKRYVRVPAWYSVNPLLGIYQIKERANEMIDEAMHTIDRTFEDN